MSFEMESALDISLNWKVQPVWPPAYVNAPGVYAWVLEHDSVEYEGRPRNHSIYYVGKSDNSIASRWWSHLVNCLRDGKYWYPASVDAFLADPVKVINEGAFDRPTEENQGQCRETYTALFQKTHYCYAEITDAGDDADLIEHVEYALQECVKCHVGITKQGWIGDARNRKVPDRKLTIKNSPRNEILLDTLPATCKWPPAHVDS